MYSFKIDIREKDKGCFYGLEAGGHYELYIEDGEVKIKLKLSYKQLDETIDNLLEQCGEKSYSELEEENILLKARLEERNNLIEQYEEYNDARMEKYFNSDGIL